MTTTSLSARTTAPERTWPVVTALGIGQILAWGSTYYLPAILAPAIAADTGWALGWVFGAFSLALLLSGLAAPSVGRLIQDHGGRPVLLSGAALSAVGLALIGGAQTLALYVIGWLVAGLGMSCGLYNAAFSSLGRLYGADARMAITNLTLFGGFASTVCWPLSAVMLDSWGWRGACFGYVVLQVAVVLPLYRFGLPGRVDARRDAERTDAERRGAERTGAERTDQDGATRGRAREAAAVRPRPAWAFLCLAASITLGSFVSTAVSVHLIGLLQSLEVGLAAAVGLGALVGPSQVGARVVEKLFGRHYHPVWTLIAAHLLITVGIGALAFGLPLFALCLVLYGAGVGIKSIARGTVPLALFGSDGYAVVMGRLALPGLMAEAAAPSAMALLIGGAGAEVGLIVLAGVSALTVPLSVALLSARRTDSAVTKATPATP